MSHHHLPSVVVVGRPNVGKSTLFNRLTGTRRSIVAPVAGTTRDVIAQPVVWQDRSFELVDTGGMFGASQDPLHELVFQRGKRALVDADLIVFVVDGREGLVSGDEEIADAVRASGHPAILVVNKLDDRRARGALLEVYRLGFDPVLEISAEHGTGTGELLDEIVRRLPGGLRPAKAPAPADEFDAEPEDGAEAGAREIDLRRGDAPDRDVAVAIVGRPNAGKSSLVNKLLREERMIVSDVPGTTRDAVDAVLMWHKRRFRIVDTAGIRRPGRVAKSGQVEAISVLLARRAIEQADVVVLVIDAVQGPADQDGAIAGEAHKAGRGVIIAANKWDLMKDGGPDASKAFDENLRYQLKFLEFAPILHISAATGERTGRLLETIDKVAAGRRTRVPTGELNRFIEQITAGHPPVAAGGKRSVRVLYAAQTGVAPPTFVFFTNVAAKFHFSYERFLENRLREKYGFFGSPIRIQVRNRGRKGMAEEAGDGRRKKKG